MACEKDGLLHSQSRSQRQYKIIINVCPDLSSEPQDEIFFLTKFGSVMQYHELVLCKKNQFTVFSVTVTVQAYIMCSVISWSVLYKNGITTVKVKFTVKVKNVTDCLSRWYLLNDRTFCYQIWYGNAAS